jgi:hypothetical protein
VAAGNHRDFVGGYRYPESLNQAPIEDPGQCWNGITIGAMTESGLPEEGPDETERNEAVAPIGGLGPTSRTSFGHGFRTVRNGPISLILCWRAVITRSGMTERSGPHGLCGW